ncbi:MAG: flavodoxin-dependent (E)-4-hydroxy-3-methylbut-2-enyl-diphosphate synthase, partial [Vulcanococcus sp.]
MTAAPVRSAAPATSAAAASATDPASWADNPRYATTIRRRKTRSVRVGDVWIGSEHPVVVQSMINEDTLDIDGATAGIRRLHEAGCEIVRVTVPSLAHAKAM